MFSGTGGSTRRTRRGSRRKPCYTIFSRWRSTVSSQTRDMSSSSSRGHAAPQRNRSKNSLASGSSPEPSVSNSNSKADFHRHVSGIRNGRYGHGFYGNGYGNGYGKGYGNGNVMLETRCKGRGEFITKEDGIWPLSGVNYHSKEVHKKSKNFTK